MSQKLLGREGRLPPISIPVETRGPLRFGKTKFLHWGLGFGMECDCSTGRCLDGVIEGRDGDGAFVDEPCPCRCHMTYDELENEEPKKKGEWDVY